MSKLYTLGWQKDPVDVRDYAFSLPRLEPIRTVYLAHTYKMPPVYDQDVLGSCTAQTAAFQAHFNLLNKNFQSTTQPIYRPSRLFIYYYTREIIGTTDVDSGGFLRDSVKVLADKGAPSEDLWNYNIANFKQRPPDRALVYGQKTQAVLYEKLNNTNKQLLVNALIQGYPISFGMYLYASFFSTEVEVTGIVPLPNINKEPYIGGHAMTIVGYRAEDDSFVVRNSWGSGWGQKGYCRIPAAYLTSPLLASDFWVVKMME